MGRALVGGEVADGGGTDAIFPYLKAQSPMIERFGLQAVGAHSTGAGLGPPAVKIKRQAALVVMAFGASSAAAWDDTRSIVALQPSCATGVKFRVTCRDDANFSPAH